MPPGAHLAVGADEERLHFDAVVAHRARCTGADGSCIAGGGGNDGVGHASTAQRGREGGRLSDTRWLAAAAVRLYMADGVVGGREGRAGVFDAHYGGLLEGGRLLGRLVSARGDWEAVWNQGLWPNLQAESQALLHMNKHCRRVFSQQNL